MRTIALIGLTASAVACAPDDAPVVETVNLNLSIANGVTFNGTSFAAAPVEHVQPEIMGPYRPGSGLFPTWQPPGFGDYNPYGGVGPNGTTMGGIKRANLRSLQVTTDMTADQLVGAEVEGVTTTGKSALLKVTGVAAGTGRNADLIYYTVHAAKNAGWRPLCGSQGGEPIPALAVPGFWDHRVGQGGGKWYHGNGGFTFVCRGSSVAKCMEAGYKPWVNARSRNGHIEHRKASALKWTNHLQACVRMLRADYCGDGQSHTTNGQMVDVWDTMKLHERSRPNWAFEAAWAPGGAVWMSRPRLWDRTPRCFNNRLGRSQDEDRSPNASLETLFEEGARIMSAVKN